MQKHVLLSWSRAQRRMVAALGLVVVLGVALEVERAVVSPIERKGGVHLTYAIALEAAVADERDRRYEALRDALATVLGLHAGDGRPSLDELRALRAKISVDRARDRGDTILLAPHDAAAAAAVDDASLKRVLGDVEIAREAARGTITARIPDAAQRSIRERAAPEVEAAVRRRLDALDFHGAAVVRSGERLSVDAPAGDGLGIADIAAVIARRGRLTFALVDDELDFFDSIQRTAREGDLPAGLSFALENAPVGPGKTKPVHFARLVRAERESMSEARSRLEAWCATLDVPPGNAIGYGKFSEYDDEKDAMEDLGYRTYLLVDRAELTGDMIVDARAEPDKAEAGGGFHVALAFTQKGGERFAEITGANVKRRFAIVLDGIVESAPVILSRIAGGHAQITMGAGAPEQQRADAKSLEVVLLSGALAAPLSLLDQRRVEPAFWRDALDRGLFGGIMAILLGLAIVFVYGRVREATAPPRAQRGGQGASG